LQTTEASYWQFLPIVRLKILYCYITFLLWLTLLFMFSTRCECMTLRLSLAFASMFARSAARHSKSAVSWRNTLRPTQIYEHSFVASAGKASKIDRAWIGTCSPMALKMSAPIVENIFQLLTHWTFTRGTSMEWVFKCDWNGILSVQTNINKASCNSKGTWIKTHPISQ
jgi:hypothetical protein